MLSKIRNSKRKPPRPWSKHQAVHANLIVRFTFFAPCLHVNIISLHAVQDQNVRHNTQVLLCNYTPISSYSGNHAIYMSCPSTCKCLEIYIHTLLVAACWCICECHCGASTTAHCKLDKKLLAHSQVLGNSHGHDDLVAGRAPNPVFPTCLKRDFTVASLLKYLYSDSHCHIKEI